MISLVVVKRRVFNKYRMNNVRKLFSLQFPKHILIEFSVLCCFLVLFADIEGIQGSLYVFINLKRFSVILDVLYDLEVN